MQWTRKTSPTDMLKPGDLIEVELTTLDGRSRRRVLLEQTPLLEGALVAIDNHTGEVLRDGRRLQLRAQQVQPRDAGASGRWARR